MKFDLKNIKNLLIAVSVFALIAGCAGHKKKHCNDCPKWSKASHHSSSQNIG